MEIQVQFFAQLRDAAGASNLSIELADGSSVEKLLAAVYERVPALRNWNENILIGAGVEFVGREHLLERNEQIALMPPVQGG